MGYQQYVIPYDTDKQLQAILDVIKLHNQEPSGYTNEYVRYNPTGEYKLLEVGEHLEYAYTVALKAGKAFKCPRTGPCLSRALLVHHGGGRSCTFDFFLWHLNRALPDVYIDAFHAIQAYGYDTAMSKRFLKDSNESIDGTRIGVLPDAEYTDAMREANRACSWAVRPAKYTTRTSGANKAFTALLSGLGSKERKKRIREERDTPPYTSSYETVCSGWVVMDKHFAILDEADAHAAGLKRAREEDELFD